MKIQIVKQRFIQFSASLDHHPWIGVMFLILLGFAYCLPALKAPFWIGNDAWSNLLPIIHYRDSILNNHAFPFHTNLWYGGRSQWENPLWSFLYFPATAVYLVTPLDWGTRIVYFGHLVFILLTARKLSSLFLASEIERIFAVIVLASPSLPAFTGGQAEKIMSWGWVLLGLYFLLEKSRRVQQRGLFTGLCLAIIPVTGSNYYALYAGILFLPLVVSFKDKKLIAFFILGAMIGLVHLPSVLYLIGHSRANAEQSIRELSLSFAGIVSSLSIGLAKPMGWETWAPVGIPVVYLFFRKIILSIKSRNVMAPVEKSLIFSFVIFILLVTSIAYQGHHFLDSFRVPARAISFIALVVVLFVLIDQAGSEKMGIGIFITISALQVGILSYMIQPYGAVNGPYDSQAQTLANVLKADGAKRVWISMRELNDMYIHVVLTQNGIALPNIYYGDMGQEVEITGNYCGYSFDHLIALAPVLGSSLELKADMEWSNAKGEISLKDLALVKLVTIHDIPYYVYRVVCDIQGRYR